MQLIADSGSTKVSWRAIKDDGSVVEIETSGINPVFMEDADIQKISVDYGIMEHTDLAWTYPAGIGWYDIGTWESLYSFFPGKDENGNAVYSDASIVQNSRDNLIVTTSSGKMLAVCDLEGYTVVDTDRVLMICPRDDRRYREFISNLLLPGNEEYR